MSRLLLWPFVCICAAASATSLDESIWFFADFDSPAIIGGEALETSLAASGVREGRFGKGYRFHRATKNLLPPMGEFLSPDGIRAHFSSAKGMTLPVPNGTGGVRFAGGVCMVTNRPSRIEYHYVRPTVAATWSFYVRGEKGDVVEVRSFLTPPTEKGIAAGRKNHKYDPSKPLKTENPTAKLTLDGTWQRVSAYATADNRISAGRETYCAIRSGKPIEMERFQYEVTGIYPCLNDFRPGLWMDGGQGDPVQIIRVVDQRRLTGFPAKAGGCSVWVRYEDDNLKGREDAPIWGLHRSWQTNRDFMLAEIRTEKKSAVGVKKPAARSTEWHHFAASWGDGKGVMWRDGVRIAEHELAAFDEGDEKPWNLRVGGSHDGDATSEAVLDEVAIFSRPLTDDDVKGLFQAKAGLCASSTALVATPVVFKVFARNQTDAALRRRVHAPTARTLRLTAMVGGLPFENRDMAMTAGWNELAVAFDPAQFRPGRYAYAHRLADREGRVALEDKGTLEIRGQVARDCFKVHSWGGNYSASSEFLKAIGVNARNVSAFSLPAIRDAVEAGLFANVRYENSKMWTGRPFAPSDVAARAEKNLAWLKGCHWWATTLVNSEVYGGGRLPAERKVKGFDALARRALGFDPAWSVSFAPDTFVWEKAGLAPARGVIEAEPDGLKAFKWYLDKGMDAIRITAATAPGIRRLSPDNVVWSEPSYAVGLAEGVDMIADWEYAYDTRQIVAALYTHASVARAAHRPFMPTLEPGYEGHIGGPHPRCVGKDGKSVRVNMSPSVDAMKVKAFLTIGAVPAANLSIFNDEVWEHGVRDAKSFLASPTNLATCIAEPDTVERFGAFMSERFLPAAYLLRNVPNTRAPVALAPSRNTSLGGGYWWGHYHYHEAIKRALARTGVPFDVLRESEQEASVLAQYDAVIAPMRNFATRAERDALAAAARGGAELVMDGYSKLGLTNATVVAGLKYEGGLVHVPGGPEKMGKPLEKWALSRRDAWRRNMMAWSEEDGDGAYTFAKELDGMKFVIVVNDTRSDDRGIFGTFCTNATYHPLCAPRRIRTHLNAVEAMTVTVFNPADGRHAVAVGKDGVIESDYAPGESKVYCLVPQPAQELKAELKGVPRVGGQTEVAFTLLAKDGSPLGGRQVVRLCVTRPDGSVADESGLVVLNGGKGSTTLRFAHDDETGSLFKKWKVEAEDLASGCQESLSFKLGK